MNEDIIYEIREYIKCRELEAINKDPPEQPRLSRWAVEEVINELRTNYISYPDEIMRNYMRLMDIYEEAAEVERKVLFRTAKNTVNDIFIHLFEGCI